MSPWEQIIERPEPCGHFVQLYKADEPALTRNVGRYVGEGLQQGQGVLVIAGPEHTEAFARRVSELGIDPDAAARNGQLAFFDAPATLSRFMAGGQPHWDLFEEVVGAAMRAVHPQAEHRGLRAYGEMVGILWNARQYAAAIRLEQFWNKLLSRSQFSLYCAYAIDVFGKEFQIGALDALLCAHTHVVPAETDGRLEAAIHGAMEEIFGPKTHELRVLIKANYRPSWAVLPPGESIALWLRNNLPEQADRILSRARELYQTQEKAFIS